MDCTSIKLQSVVSIWQLTRLSEIVCVACCTCGCEHSEMGCKYAVERNLILLRFILWLDLTVWRLLSVSSSISALHLCLEGYPSNEPWPSRSVAKRSWWWWSPPVLSFSESKRVTTKSGTGTFEIGDNIGWHRLQAPVQRESTFRGRLMVSMVKFTQRIGWSRGWVLLLDSLSWPETKLPGAWWKLTNGWRTWVPFWTVRLLPSSWICTTGTGPEWWA